MKNSVGKKEKKNDNEEKKEINKQNSFISKEDAPKKEEVCEIFNVEKNGKGETVESCGTEEEKGPSHEQMKKESKIFLKIVLVMLGLVSIFLVTYGMIYLTENFQVGGVKFSVDKSTMAGMTLYKTSLPVNYNGGVADYNFWLRDDPRKTNKINFIGNLSLQKNMVLNMTNSLNCNGNGIIATANLLKLYGVLGVKVIRDENASCDPEGKYMFLNIQEGNETKVEQFGPLCYNIQINKCEILPGTEKFMIETFSYVHKKV